MDNYLNSRSYAAATSLKKYRAGLIATFGAVVCLAIVRVAANLGFFSLFNLPDAAFEIVTSIFWPVLGGAVVPFFLYFFLVGSGPFLNRFSPRTIRAELSGFGFGKVSYGIVLLSVLLGVVYSVANSGIAIVSQNILIAMGFRLSGGADDLGGFGYLIAVCVTSAVMPALFEEFTCRGTLLKSLRRHGEINAIFLSALVFALFHMNLAQTFYTFVMGVVTAFITLRLRSIWPAIIIHFINNFGGTVLYYLYAKGLPGKQFYELVNNIAVNAPMVLLGVWGVAIALSVMVIYGMLRYLKHHDSYLLHRHEVAKRKSKLEAQREIVSQTVDADNGAVAADVAVEGGEVVDADVAVEGGDAVADQPLTVDDVEDFSEQSVLDMYSALRNSGISRIADEHSGYNYSPKYIDKMWFIATLIVAGGATLFSIIWAII